MAIAMADAGAAISACITTDRTAASENSATASKAAANADRPIAPRLPMRPL
jgi:hypothetical protein